MYPTCINSFENTDWLIWCGLQLFPAWCFALTKAVFDVPVCAWEAMLWTAIPYFAMGYAKNAGRY